MQFSVVASLLLLATSSFVSAVYQPDINALQANDLHVLQYALILEQLEFAFYSTFQAKFTAADFVNANIGLTAADYSYFNLIRDHERAHVFFLNTSAGVPSATSSCTYNFPVNTVADYVALAYVLENVGVSAYDGAINNIYNPAIQQAAATIATVEARHTSYISKVHGESPFPAAFDQAMNSSSVANIVFNTPLGESQQPLATCTFVAGFQLPELLYVYPVQNASDSTQPTPQSLTANDVTVLQYALFLEHLEAAFYAYVLSNFTNAQFTAAYGNQSYGYVQMIGDHEKTHVDALTSVIEAYGATPLADCTYNFASAINGSIQNAIAIAAALEATGVGAYDGAVNAINDPTYKEIAATIATVEARHASYINGLYGGNGTGPVQGAGGPFDIALTFNQTFGIVVSTNLIVSCPAFPTPYSVLLVQPYTNSTFTHNAGTTGTTGTTGTVTTGTTGTTGTAPTSTPTTSSPTSTPTVSPATTGVTPAPTPATTGVTPAPSPASTTATTRGVSSSTTARTSGASIASASVVVALLVAVAAF